MEMPRNETINQPPEVPRSERKKLPLYKKLIGAGILVATAFYCMPELQKTLCAGIRALKDEWRK